MNLVTGHKAFDKQSEGCISTGNVMSNVQFSFFIRPFCETKCNGYINPEGYLRDYDLEIFRKTIPRGVLQRVLEETVDKSVILYKFRSWRKGKEIIHGWVITDDNHNLIYEMLAGKSPKSDDVLRACVKEVSKGKS